jgi:hypothetical protein
MVTYQTHRRSSLAHTTVAEAMRPGVAMCGAEQRLPVVGATMVSHSIHNLLVCNAESDWPRPPAPRRSYA